MTPTAPDAHQLIRNQIAAAAARLIAQDGSDYGSAKRKAARQLLGPQEASPHLLPDNAQIEEELRQYQALFHADTQPARLAHLRMVALQVLDMLKQFDPYLTGSVLGGTAGEHDDIRIQVFAESAKDVEIFLLNQGLAIDLSEAPHFKGPRFDSVEVVSFLWRNEGIHVEIYDADDLRGAKRLRPDGRPWRADAAAVRALMDAPAAETETTETI